MKRILFLLALFFTLTACGQLDSIPCTPAQTPETWLQIQPYVEFKSIIFVQPSTSIIVYLLGVITIWVGFFFLKKRNSQRSSLWWGIALLLWGIGAHCNKRNGQRGSLRNLAGVLQDKVLLKVLPRFSSTRTLSHSSLALS